MALRLIIVASLFLAFVGCRTTKGFEGKKAKHISESKLIDSVVHYQLEYNNLFIKRFDGTVDFDGNKLSFKGAMYLQKDSQIIVSIMPLMGIELFKVKVTPSEIIIIDKTKKKVIYGDIGYLSRKFDVSFGFELLQAVLSNHSLALGCSDELASCLKSYKYDVLKDGYLLTSQMERRNRAAVGSRNLIQLVYLPDIYKLGKFNLKDLNRNSELKVNYSQFNKFGKAIFPKQISISGLSGGKEANFSMSIDILEIDGANGLSFKVPEKYEKVTMGK